MTAEPLLLPTSRTGPSRVSVKVGSPYNVAWLGG